MKSIVKHYILFLTGLICNGLGVAIITKSSLGTTPIASIPFTLSIISPKFTIGNYTIFVSIIFILLQLIILQGKTNIIEIILQIPISILFGYVIDLFMWIMNHYSPEKYAGKLLTLFTGCIVIGLGVYFQVTADVTMLPADGLARSIVKRLNQPFGKIKVITDSCQALISIILGLIFIKKVVGVREGTLIAAILIGNIVKLLQKNRFAEKCVRKFLQSSN